MEGGLSEVTLAGRVVNNEAREQRLNRYLTVKAGL